MELERKTARKRLFQRAGLVAVLLLMVGVRVKGAEVLLLNGTKLKGDLARLDSDVVVLSRGGKQQRARLKDVLKIELGNTATRGLGKATTFVYLVDGSIVQAKSVTIDRSRFLCRLLTGEDLNGPASALKAAYFGDGPGNDDLFLEALRDVKHSTDVLLVKKEGTVQTLSGGINAYDGQKAHFFWEGEEFNVGRKKIAGMVFFRAPAETSSEVVCKIEEARGNKWLVSSILLEKARFVFQTGSGIRHSCPVAAVKTLDFSIGKIVYLSDIEPVAVQSTRGVIDAYPWDYQRDKNLWGDPIQLGGRTYKRGLALHSRCRLVFRLGKRYRRFRCVVGIEDFVRGGGAAVCQILGDDRKLYENTFVPGQKPQHLDLDVSGVELLTLFVDFGPDLDFGDNISFADARVVK